METILESTSNIQTTILESTANIQSAVLESTANIQSAVIESTANISSAVLESTANISSAVIESTANIQSAVIESTANIQAKLTDWKNEDRRCKSCKEGLCSETDGSICQEPYKCPCKCAVGSKEDTINKAATIGGGVALFAGGTALAMLAPIALPGVMLMGGIIGSAGASAAIHGIQKSVAGEKISNQELAYDVGVGAVSGLLTAGISSGIGAVSPLLTGGAATATTTTTQIGVSAGTGVLNGITSKAVNETATVLIGEKELVEWGQSASGSATETLKEWTIPIATGALGGVVGVSTDVSATK
jgi:hypothetical protein